MSELYKEAIAEAKKLKELAEIDAKNNIVEAIAPYIKQLIAKESASISFIQEIDEQVQLPELMPVQDELPKTDSPIISKPEGLPSSSEVGSVSPVVPSAQSDVGVSLPGADGKITVDFEQLFAPVGQGDVLSPVDLAVTQPGEAVPSPAEEPAPVEPVEQNQIETMEEVSPMVVEVTTFDQFKSEMSDVALKIDTSSYRGRISDIQHESIKNKLFNLLESLDYLAENGNISTKQCKINEKRLDFLFLKLKEATLRNSYSKENEKKDNTMARSLKEFAAKLFESEENLGQDAVSSNEIGLKTDEEATRHSHEVSGISPEVDNLFGEKGESQTVSIVTSAGSVNADPASGTSVDMPWHEGEPVKEEVEAKAHAGFGDSNEKPSSSQEMVFEVDEEELKEAVRSIRKENIAKKVKAVKEAADAAGWEKGKPEGGDNPAKKVLKKESKTVKEQMGMEEDLVLNIDLPDEIENQLSDEDLDVDFEFTDEDEEELPMNLGDSEEGEENPFDVSSEESEEEDLEEVPARGMDEENYGMEEMEQMKLENKNLVKKLIEARKYAAYAKKLAESHKTDVVELKKSLTETNLFLSKLLYLNKFLQMEGLSRKQKQQIVEHLDRAATVAEAKEIYGKIKNKLNEASMKTKNLVGSASKPTTAGSAKLTEGLDNASVSSDPENGDPIVGTFERWQKLAKIKENG